PKAARPVDSISFFKELTPGGEPHGVSSFQFPIMIIVRSYCAARFPKSSRMPAQTRGPPCHVLYFTPTSRLCKPIRGFFFIPRKRPQRIAHAVLLSKQLIYLPILQGNP
ncbi:MAG: hypothetical protein IKP58_15195, partial [Victivallales bacterium]|nr:hypothetical protein [Victivallales bacterium]